MGDTSVNFVSGADKVEPMPEVEENHSTSKGWYITALVVGIVVTGGGVFGVIGLIQSYGVTLPQWLNWLTPAINTVGNTPNFWSLWTMAIGGGVAGIIIIALASCRIHKIRTVENFEEKWKQLKCEVVMSSEDLIEVRRINDQNLSEKRSKSTAGQGVSEPGREPQQPGEEEQQPTGDLEKEEGPKVQQPDETLEAAKKLQQLREENLRLAKDLEDEEFLNSHLKGSFDDLKLNKKGAPNNYEMYVRSYLDISKSTYTVGTFGRWEGKGARRRFIPDAESYFIVVHTLYGLQKTSSIDLATKDRLIGILEDQSRGYKLAPTTA